MSQYHLVGIKGTGMSALAQVLHGLGHEVQGSDHPNVFFTQASLEEQGIPFFPFDRANIGRLGEEATVVVSNAYRDDHEELEEARRLRLPVERYHQFLGKLIEPFTSISVTGAHGKTTTSGLMAHVFTGLAPTSYIVGDGSGKGTRGDRYFILESCEYRRHFLAYHPDYAVITNIDFDHPDYFSDPDDVKRAFQEMARQVKKGIVACGDDPATLELEVACPILNYGFGEINHLRARNVTRNVGGTAFDAWDGSRKLGRFHIPLHGDHNVLNTLAVIGICLLEGLDLGRVASRLPAFPGVRRRFAEKPYASNVVIDDYAHHPNEVKATIQAARSKYPHKPLVVIFQPHTYSRLKHFLDGFAASLAEADELYLCDIFGSAREADGNVSIHSLLAKLPRARHLTRENISDLLEHRESVLLFMGAGDIQKYQRWMMEME